MDTYRRRYDSLGDSEFCNLFLSMSPNETNTVSSSTGPPSQRTAASSNWWLWAYCEIYMQVNPLEIRGSYRRTITMITSRTYSSNNMKSVHWPLTSSSFLACNSRLRSAIRWHHSPKRVVLSQICCFGERKVVLFQILLDGAEPRDAGTT